MPEDWPSFVGLVLLEVHCRGGGRAMRTVLSAVVFILSFVWLSGQGGMILSASCVRGTVSVAPCCLGGLSSHHTLWIVGGQA